MAAGNSSDQDLKTTLAQARKKPLAFGLCLGKKPDTTVLMTHKTKAPSVLGQQARKAGDTSKFTFGMMSVRSKNLQLTCEGDVPAGAGRKIKEYLKSAGFAMKVILLDATGSQIEGDDEEDEGGESAAAISEPQQGSPESSPSGGDDEDTGDEDIGEDGPDPLLEEWEKARKKLETAIEKATDIAGEAIGEVNEKMQALVDQAAGGAYDLAMEGISGVAEALKSVVKEGRKATQVVEADKDRWEKARDKLTPMIEQVLEAGAGNVRKIEALWNFAKSKAEAENPDYAAAIKVISMLVTLIGEARAALAEMAGAEAAEAAPGVDAPPAAGSDGMGDAGPGPAPSTTEAPDAATEDPGAAAPPSEGPATAGSLASDPEPTPPADLSGSVDEKITRARDRLSGLDGLTDTYMAILSGSAEVMPPEWNAEKRRIEGEITAQESAGASADEGKVDQALEDIVALERDIRAKTAAKQDWADALELFRLRLVPVESHAQAGAVPQIKPKLDAIKADLATAEADAAVRDFAKAQRALPGLATRCDELVALADDFAHYEMIYAQRQGVVNPLMGAAPTGVTQIDNLTTEMIELFNKARADAAVDEFADAVRKLDQIPPLAEERAGLVQYESDYRGWQGEVVGNTATIDAFAADTIAPFATEITTWKANVAQADVRVTGDYMLSRGLMTELAVQSRRIISDCNLHQAYLAKLPPFETQLASFESHPGRAGIEDFILAMQNDLTQAQAEAASQRYVTATSLLDHTNGQWAAQQAIADDCEQYTVSRDTVQAEIDALRSRPAAAEGIAQADALMGAAANQALGKEFATARNTLDEAKLRAQEAKTAADAQDALGALRDETALDNLSADFEAAFAVFTAMRAEVAAADGAGGFTGLIAGADGPAAAARTAAEAATPDFAAARISLDQAIAHLEDALSVILASEPFQRHLAEVRTMQVTTLPPLNIDDCIKQAIAEVKRLGDEAESAVADPGYDFASGEAKLIDAMAIARRAESGAALYPDIKAFRTTIDNIRTSVTSSPVASYMGHTETVLDDLISDIDTALAADDFATARRKGETGAAMQAAVQQDIGICQSYDSAKDNWYLNRLASLTSPAAQPGLDKAKERFDGAEAAMVAGNYDGGLNALNAVSWAVDEAERAQTEAAAYETAKTTAETKLNALKAVTSPVLADRINVIDVKFSEAEGLAAATPANYFGAERKMQEIPAECDALMALATAGAAYEQARSEAETARAGIEAHAQAEAIRPAIDRLVAKYDSARTMADNDDFATATAMMHEVSAAAEEAGTAADHAAIFDGIADAVGDLGDDEGPALGQITAAQGVLLYLQSRDDAAIAAEDLALAGERIAFAGNDGNPPAERSQALRDAMDATRRAESTLVQHRELMRAIETARDRIATLGSHPQVDYVIGQINQLSDDLDAIVLRVSSGTGIEEATAELNQVMERYAQVQADADGQAAFVELRAKPELDDRLEELVKHDHSYAIRPSIDTMRSKIAYADEQAAAGEHDTAITELNEAIQIGISALVMADMRADTPPSVENIRAIMNGPGGLDELDAMIDQLEPDAKITAIRVAFEARFGTSLENWQGSTVVGNDNRPGPDIQRFYQIMADLPIAHTLENDSFRVFRNEETGGSGSRYSGTDKAVIMDEGDPATSGPYMFGREDEVGTVEPGCEPANEDPVSRFSWNTLHEVGHAVDDQQGFMDTRQSGAAYGGWQVYGPNTQPVADALAGHFDYDAAYIGQKLANATAVTAIPDAPSGVEPQEWESRRLRVDAHMDAMRVGQNPWNSMASANRLAIDGRVYQQSYASTWTSYELAARSRGITAYQFRAPGEWFSELYAAYHSGKLKDTHPSASWLSSL
ncbi:MAG: hypothetical protein ACK5M4_09830 [Pseudorhodobacter sp.]